MSLTPTQVAQARVAVGLSMGTVGTVETYSGDSAYGPLYAAPVSVTCNIDATRRLVRGSDGVEVVSERTLEVAAADETKFTPGSRFTAATFATTVLAVGPKAYKGQVVYVEISCS